MTLWEILNYNLVDVDGYNFTVYRLFLLLFIFIGIRLSVWFIRKLLLNRFRLVRSIDKGKQFAIIQLTTYIIYVIGVTIAFEIAGVGLSIFWAGSAALLVGVGLGLQQTFNDLVSGLILLFEGSVRVGDIIELDGVLVGKVISIGLRTSTLDTRDSIVIIVPNSKFIVEKVINWSSNNRPTRFIVSVGVVYNSDVLLVQKLLIEAAMQQEDVVKIPQSTSPSPLEREMPFVRFQNFGESSLEFDLLFWTTNMWEIEIIKSHIRFTIDKLFRENNIILAFPQRDLHFKIDDEWIEKLRKVLGK